MNLFSGLIYPVFWLLITSFHWEPNKENMQEYARKIMWEYERKYVGIRKKICWNMQENMQINTLEYAEICSICKICQLHITAYYAYSAYWQYAEYALYRQWTIILHIIWHIGAYYCIFIDIFLHIYMHILHILHIAICRICTI
jgi:hypothetical protein